MINDLLIDDITKRITKEMGSVSFSRPFHRVIKIDSPDFNLNLGNDLYYLVSERIDIPAEYKVSISSSDNYLRTSKLDYELLSCKLNSFRNYLNVKTRNYAEFQPYKLEFLIIVPE